jgi:glycine cleavage system transcriptional repressor
MNQAMLTVFGKDRPGIIAEVSGILFRHGCNLEDISMTILEGEFAMMLILSFRKEKGGPIRQALERIRKEWQLTFFWKDLEERLRRGEKHPRGSGTYLVRVIGRDRTGIVYQTSRLLARYGLNITDLNSKILGRAKQTVYTMLLEVDIPKKFPIGRLKRRLQALGKKLKLEFLLKSVERIEL